ncbi:MAG: SDR family oxidoreductase [bacterium]|nr:SDR family oxidoreductase [bacterium]
MTYISNLYSIKEKVSIVTGACGQLGAKTCEAFLEAGASVTGVDVDTSKNRLSGVEYYDLDISSKKAVFDVFESIFDKYGKVDILINNAGVSTFDPFEERPEDKFDRVMDINLKGTFWCIQSYVNLMDKLEFKKGAIVNIASIYGIISPDYRIYTDCPRKNSEIYGATKAGIIQMTRYFAVHLADRNIRVNAISPGGIFNPENPQGDDFRKNYSFRCPMKRMAESEEMLGAIIYLASDAASYTTGQNIIIDGGLSCW